MNKRNILLSPDEATGGVEVDPLSAAAQGWQAPKYPCLAPDRIVQLKIGKCTKAPVKDKEGREQIVITLKPVEGKTYSDTEGKPMVNFTGFKRIGINEIPAEEDKRPRTWKDVGADLAMVLKACGMGASNSPRDLINNPSLVDGQVVDMKIGLQKASGSFPESNTFTFVLPA